MLSGEACEDTCGNNSYVMAVWGEVMNHDGFPVQFNDETSDICTKKVVEYVQLDCNTSAELVRGFLDTSMGFLKGEASDGNCVECITHD